MLPQLARAGLNTSARAAWAAPRMVPAQALVARRNYSSAKDGTPDGKAKLAFRFGLKDVPVELWPMFVIVAACCGGATFAVGRQFYRGEATRLLPSGWTKKKAEDGH